MVDDDYDYYSEMQDDAIAALIEDGIRDQQQDQIRDYLLTYGNAVQDRINRRMSESRKLLEEGFTAPAVLPAVTVVELAIFYYIVRPVLEGSLLPEDLTRVLVREILGQNAGRHRKILPAILRAWDIDLTAVNIESGEPLWSTFCSKSEGAVLRLRNNIAHKGAGASHEEAAKALSCAESFLDSVIAPLADYFGLSWSETRRWNPTRQGVGGAKWSSKVYPEEDPF